MATGTATSLCLLNLGLRWRCNLYHFPPPTTCDSFAGFRVRKNFGKIRVKCCFTGGNGKTRSKGDGDSADQNVSKNSFVKAGPGKNPFDIVANAIVNCARILQKPAVAAVILGFLLLYDPNVALAASGGRVGGNSFSSRRPSTSSSSTYSVPRMEGGSAFSYSAPYYGPTPFGGVYVGPAVGIGSSFYLIMIAFAAFVLVSGFLSDGSGSSVLSDTEKTSVIKLQVGLLGLGRSLQEDLNRIAENADTSTPQGLHYVLTETVLALLRHPDYCISAYSSVDVKKNVEQGEKKFNQFSIEERGKFDEETLVNVNSIKKQSSGKLRTSRFTNEYIVITILVAAEGFHKLPSINNSQDLKEALQKLASIPSNRTLAVEVLWTPQNEDDTLTERELLEDYPLLRPL